MATTPSDQQIYKPRVPLLRSRTFHLIVSRTITYGLLIAGSIAMLTPLVWLIRSSFMSLDQIFYFPPEWIPEPWLWQNYRDAMEVAPFDRYFLNTMVIEVLVVTGVVLSSTLSAYGFSRLRWKGRDVVFGILMTTMMLPGAVTLIPAFIIWSKLGLTDSIAPLTIPAWFGGGMFNIFLLRQFFRGLPRDLDEAAMLDGASPLRILKDIIVPLSRPALITVAIFSFLYTWNDFLGPLIYLSSNEKYTLAIGLSQFKGQYNSEWGLLMAASTLILTPCLVLFFIAQRYFVQGIAVTGLKG